MGKLRFVLPMIIALVIVLASSSPAFAVLTCTVSVETLTTDVNVGDEFEVQIWIRGLDSTIDLFSIFVAWDNTQLDLVWVQTHDVSGWSFMPIMQYQTPNPDIHFITLQGATASAPIDTDEYWATLTFRCLAVGEAHIEAPVEITDQNFQVNTPAVVHDHEGEMLEYIITGSEAIIQQHPPAPPSNPPQHVGGELFSANKTVIFAPYLMAVLSAVAIAAIVIKRRSN